MDGGMGYGVPTSISSSSSSIGLTLHPNTARPPDPYLLRQMLKKNPIAFYDNLLPIAPNHVHLLRYNDRQMLTNNIHDQLQSAYRYQNDYGVDLEMEMEMERDRERDRDSSLTVDFDQNENNKPTFLVNTSHRYDADKDLNQNDHTCNLYRKGRNIREYISEDKINQASTLDMNSFGQDIDCRQLVQYSEIDRQTKENLSESTIRKEKISKSSHTPLNRTLNRQLIERHQNLDLPNDDEEVQLASISPSIPKVNGPEEDNTSGGFSLSTFLRNSVQVNTPQIVHGNAGRSNNKKGYSNRYCSTKRKRTSDKNQTSKEKSANRKKKSKNTSNDMINDNEQSEICEIRCMNEDENMIREEDNGPDKDKKNKKDKEKSSRKKSSKKDQTKNIRNANKNEEANTSGNPEKKKQKNTSIISSPTSLMQEEVVRFSGEVFDVLETDLYTILGYDTDSLVSFIEKCEESKAIIFTMMWADLSTTFISVSEKLCTPKQICSHWNCSCGKHIRAARASTPYLVGALFFLVPYTDDEWIEMAKKSENTTKSEEKVKNIFQDNELRRCQGATSGKQSVENISTEGFGKNECFFLPLARTRKSKKNKKRQQNLGEDQESDQRSKYEGLDSEIAFILPLPDIQAPYDYRWACFAQVVAMKDPVTREISIKKKKQDNKSNNTNDNHNTPCKIHEGGIEESHISVGISKFRLAPEYYQNKTQNDAEDRSYEGNIILPSPTKVCFNAQVGLMPLINWYNSTEEKECLVSSSICNLVDPKVASWMIDTNWKDKDLEFNSLCRRFSNNNNYPSLEILSSKSTSEGGKIASIISAFSAERNNLFTCYSLWENLKVKLSHENLLQPFLHIEMPLLSILSSMEVRGICVDKFHLNDLLQSIDQQISICQEEIYDSVESAFHENEGKLDDTEDLYANATKDTRHHFNIDSPEQVSNVLFKILKLPVPLLSNSFKNNNSMNSSSLKHASTNEEVLNALKPLHPVVPLLLSYRSLSKFKTGHINQLLQHVTHDQGNPFTLMKRQILPQDSESKEEPLYTLIKKENYRIYTSWNQCQARTGRLSSTKPAIQAIPKSFVVKLRASERTDKASESMTHLPLKDSLVQNHKVREVKQGENGEELHANIRNTFVASPGYTLISADYSQIEMRIMCHYANDVNMKQVFEGTNVTTTSEGGLKENHTVKGDVYKMTVAKLKKKPVDEVTTEERNQAKTVCLGIIYGMGISQVAQKLNISVNEATQLYKAYFEAFPSIESFMKRTKEFAKEKGYIRTATGRKREILDISHPASRALQAQGERQAVNSVIQGTATDLLKLAMVLIQQRLDEFYQEKCDEWNTLSKEEEDGDKTQTEVSRRQSVDRFMYKCPHLILSIHDELIYEVPANQEIMKKVKRIIQQCMEVEVLKYIPLNVPLKVNMTVGLKWGKMKELKN